MPVNQLKCFICPVFNISAIRKFEHEDINAAFINKKILHYAAGEPLYKEGTASTGVYCIYEGNVEITKRVNDDLSVIVNIAKQGDNIGIHTFPEEVHSTSAKALTDAVICFIPKQDLMVLLDTNNKYRMEIMKLQCEKIENLETNPKRKRKGLSSAELSLLLASFIRQYGLDNEGCIKTKISILDLASSSGSSLAEVYKCLSDLISKGSIIIMPETIDIKDPLYFLNRQ